MQNFEWDGIEYTVDEAKREISFTPSGETNITVYKCGTIIPDFVAETIFVTPGSKFKVDPATGNPVGGFSAPISERRYTNSDLNQLGQGYWDFFYNLEGRMGEVITKALINNQLENMSKVFGEGEMPTIYNPYAGWTFYYPLHLVVDTIPETSGGTEDGSVALSVENAQAGVDYEFTADGGATWQDSGSFSGLASGSYTVGARSKSDMIPKYKAINIDIADVE